MTSSIRDQCGREWRSLSVATGTAAHKCRRDDGHSGEHVCSCGAQRDERPQLEVDE